MAETIRLTDPQKIDRNPDNPRIIFHQDELEALEDSIRQQGILVPLTVYGDHHKLFLIDGERRWRSALKLGMTRVPVIVQPKPDPLQNLMMMFAIHHRRKDWDPLPSALKLRDLERLFTKRQGRKPTEAELAELASLTRGEVRRFKKLLRLPQQYIDELMTELKRPRSEQVITVDHVLEATNAAAILRKREVINEGEEEKLRKALLRKFRTGTIKSTVSPRLLARISRAVARNEISRTVAHSVALKVINQADYTPESAFKDSIEQADFEHSVEQLVERLIERLEEHQRRRYRPSAALTAALERLKSLL
jgi:ParB family transcriptional regulator, chromosome partitioning protein